MSRPLFSRFLTGSPLRLICKRPFLCAAGLVLATGSAVYFYSKYYGLGEDAPATVESVDRVVTVEEGNKPTLDQEEPVLVQYVDEEVRHHPCVALIPWSGPQWIPSSQPMYYLTHAGRMLVRELTVLNTQIVTMEQPIVISFTPARRMVWEDMSSLNEQVAIHMQYVDEEVGHKSCLALIPWSGPLCVPISPVTSNPKHVYYLTPAGRMLVTELAVLNTQTSKLVIGEPTLHLTDAGKIVLDKLSAPSDSHSQPYREESGFPNEKLQLVENWGSFHFHCWKIHYGRVQENSLEQKSDQIKILHWGYFKNQGTTNFSLRLAGIRRAMEALTSSDSTSLNYLTHAGRMVLSGLSELNQQDVRQFQQAYDLLMNFINESANRERLEQEMALVGIDHINFTDIFYEFVLLSFLEGKTSLPTSRPGSFLYLLLEVTMRIHPPGGAWTEAAGNFFLLVKGQMKAWLESIFNLDESIYESPERLLDEVMGNLERQVEFLLSSLD